jgi:hypothetical protein
MRIIGQWQAPIPEEAAPTPKASKPPTAVTVLVNGKLVCVTIPDEPPASASDGVCNCGGCQGGRHPDSAADYY